MKISIKGRFASNEDFDQSRFRANEDFGQMKLRSNEDFGQMKLRFIEDFGQTKFHIRQIFILEKYFYLAISSQRKNIKRKEKMRSPGVDLMTPFRSVVGLAHRYQTRYIHGKV
jgi:hypothetical protein